MYAAAYVLSGRNLRRDLSLLSYVAIVYTTAAVLMTVVMVSSRTPFTGYPPQTWLVFVLITIGPQFLGHTVFNYLLGYLEANVVALAIMAEPVGATVLAFALLSESPPAGAIVGGALILTGVYLAIAAQSRRAVVEAPVD
jgi:drug/metabolite transporter (DMT)-like permease